MQQRINLFVDADLKADLESLARSRGTSMSSIIREAAAEYVAAQVPKPTDDLADLCGWYDGSPDASTTIDEAVYGRSKRA